VRGVVVLGCVACWLRLVGCYMRVYVYTCTTAGVYHSNIAQRLGSTWPPSQPCNTVRFFFHLKSETPTSSTVCHPTPAPNHLNQQSTRQPRSRQSPKTSPRQQDPSTPAASQWQLSPGQLQAVIPQNQPDSPTNHLNPPRAQYKPSPSHADSQSNPWRSTPSPGPSAALLWRAGGVRVACA